MSDKKALQVITLLSVAVLIFLFWLIYFKEGAEVTSAWVSELPKVNALLNSITTAFLIAGFVFIKNGKRQAHINSMLSATFTSALFLISYIIYHHYQGDTPFLTQGILRPIYFFILISHIILSMAIVPLVFTTLYFAARSNFQKHKKIAKITFPIWIYVSITGVLIYFFVHHLNTSASVG